jgi:hypothetical protein
MSEVPLSGVHTDSSEDLPSHASAGTVQPATSSLRYVKSLVGTSIIHKLGSIRITTQNDLHQ